jgi:hypothetical protein
MPRADAPVACASISFPRNDLRAHRSSCRWAAPVWQPARRAPPVRANGIAPGTCRAPKPPFAERASCPHPGAAVLTRGPVSRAGWAMSTRAPSVPRRQGVGLRRRGRSPLAVWRHLHGRVPLGPRRPQEIPDVPTQRLTPLFGWCRVSSPSTAPARGRWWRLPMSSRVAVVVASCSAPASPLAIGRSTDGVFCAGAAGRLLA